MKKYSIYLQPFNAGLCGLLGLLASFLPQEILAHLQVVPNNIEIFLIKLIGAFYLSLALLNYMVRKTMIGGIYGKPIVATNLTHYGIGSILLIKELISADEYNIYVLFPIALYCLMALAYFRLLSIDPSKSNEV